MTFGQKIKKRHKEPDYTRAELAERVHTTQPYISCLERGDFNPSKQMIINIATTLNINISDDEYTHQRLVRP